MYQVSKRIRAKVGKVIAKYSLIEKDDRVLLGFSGGKDSIILLLSLVEELKRSPIKFELEAAYIDIFNGKYSTRGLIDFCKRVGVKLNVITTDIYSIVTEKRREKSPCSLCAHFRRGFLCSFASENGFNKVALGHNMDDVVETIFLNLLFSGRFKCFKPKMWHSRKAVWVIRPLIYVTEWEIQQEIGRLGITPLDKEFKCPIGEDTNRKRVKDLISFLEKINPQIRYNILTSLERFKSEDVWSTQETHEEEEFVEDELE